MAIVLFFWDWKKKDRSQTLLGWLESKMRLESFYIWVKLRFQHVHVWCLERGRKGGGGIVLNVVVVVVVGGVFAGASSVSDHQVDSQMATPSADPCLALAGAQLASAAEQAGRRAQPRGEICGRGDHMASVTSVTLCIASFSLCLIFVWICSNILDPDP